MKKGWVWGEIKTWKDQQWNNWNCRVSFFFLLRIIVLFYLCTVHKNSYFSYYSLILVVYIWRTGCFVLARSEYWHICPLKLLGTHRKKKFGLVIYLSIKRMLFKMRRKNVCTIYNSSELNLEWCFNAIIKKHLEFSWFNQMTKLDFYFLGCLCVKHYCNHI